jgi:pimeloyl-ACP methyl ester carboxylesterase
VEPTHLRSARPWPGLTDLVRLPRPDAPADAVETAVGRVQYTRLGEGPPVLVVHGTPGGYDQGVVLARFIVEAGFEAIVASRPGYCGTPLDELRSPDKQAQLLVALLDQLGIDRVGVLCWSGGGASAYRLAAREPDRVPALVAFGAVSKAWQLPSESRATKALLSTRLGLWVSHTLLNLAPKQMITQTLAAEGSLTKRELKTRVSEVLADEKKKRFVLDLDATVSYRAPRKTGYENDVAQFKVIDSLGLEQIQAPCLIVHGSADTDVSPDHGENAANTIPNAELLVLERGTHLCLYTHPDAYAAQERALGYLGRSD